MLIPLGTDRPIRRPSVVTPTLIVLCVAAFVVQRWADANGDTGDFERRFMVVGGEAFEWYRTVTYAFLHGDFLHIAGNMLFLWVFGRPVEDRLGRLGFAGLYLAGAVASGVGQVWLDGSAAIGASGAVSAVTGAFLVLFPRTRIRVLWFMIIISLLMAPAWFFIGLQIAWNILAGVTRSAGNVAVVAHLAGYAFGFAVAFVLLASRLIGKEPYDLFSISKQAKRRQDFRSAARLADRRHGPVSGSRGRDRDEPRAMDERSEALAKDRAAVSAALAEHRLDRAVAAYRTLIERHAMRDDADRSAVTLSRNAQYRLATHLASDGSASLAIRAFDDFLGAYPRDPEAGAIRVLLARLCAGMGAASRARRLLSEVIESDASADLKAMARGELEAMGGAAPGAPGTDGGNA